jgi:hypothetical protein
MCYKCVTTHGNKSHFVLFRKRKSLSTCSTAGLRSQLLCAQGSSETHPFSYLIGIAGPLPEGTAAGSRNTFTEGLLTFEAEVEVPLRLTVSQSVRFGIESLPGAHNQILLIISNHT